MSILKWLFPARQTVLLFSPARPRWSSYFTVKEVTRRSHAMLSVWVSEERNGTKMQMSCWLGNVDTPRRKKIGEKQARSDETTKAVTLRIISLESDSPRVFHIIIVLLSVLCVCVSHVCLTGQLRRSPMLLALRSSSPNMSGVGLSLHSSILTAWLLQHWVTHTHTHTQQRQQNDERSECAGIPGGELLWIEENIYCEAQMWLVATRNTVSIL